MSSSGDGSACPNDPVVFTCVVTGRTSLLWTVDPPFNHTSGANNIAAEELLIVIRGSDGIRTLLPSGPEGFMFQAAITATSSDNLTPTLSTLTEVSSLNGTTVSCLGGQTETLIITLAGELIIIEQVIS